jgi:hypothetical protein
METLVRMKKAPAHVAIVIDAASAAKTSAALQAARAVIFAARHSGVRFLTLAPETDAELEAEDGRDKNVPAAPARVGTAAWLRQALRGEILEAGRDGLSVQILAHSGRPDLVRAARELAMEVAAGRLRPEEVDIELLRQSLSTAPLPDLDLIILCGRQKFHHLSSCLLFESAYAEFHFCETQWTNFNVAEWSQALHDYGLRERRFGRTSAQVTGQVPEKVTETVPEKLPERGTERGPERGTDPASAQSPHVSSQKPTKLTPLPYP